jgi:hypothetical protein
MKPSNCLSNELAIATVMAENEYELVNKEIVKDLVVDGGTTQDLIHQKELLSKE